VARPVLVQSFAGKRILLIVGGGIAAYKALELVRRLRERGASLCVVMTAAAKQFVTELSFVSLAGERVYHDLFSPTVEQEMGHIQLSRDADLVVVAPATAHLLARMARGFADDLATTLLLATDKRVLVAPAMNMRMWLHPATRRNIAALHADGVWFVGPEEGDMACGEYGPGRMSEPADIIAAIEKALASDTRLPLPQMSVSTHNLLAGRHLIVTSGPTYERIDPVRYIANRSSGKQGHAVAAAAAALGARVTLITGPVALGDPPGVDVRHVETAREMLEAVSEALPADIFVGAAAVADWRVDESRDKIKKAPGGEPPALSLRENPDILETISKAPQGRPALVVGFAAETRDLIANARAKLERKGCDMIVANDVSESAGVFGADDNEVHLVSASGVTSWPRSSKTEIAAKLLIRLADELARREGSASKAAS
jgi:phosphopantothenoylcysteine decarboxylase/phosphopantothenate--cysteine ligase